MTERHGNGFRFSQLSIFQFVGIVGIGMFGGWLSTAFFVVYVLNGVSVGVSSVITFLLVSILGGAAWASGMWVLIGRMSEARLRRRNRS